MAPEADDPALFLRGVQELQRIVSGKTASNYIMGLDACSSGIQILACLSGCMTTASQCGLVKPDERSDVYTKLADVMNEYLDHEDKIGVGPDAFTRNDLKEPFMTHWYYSHAVPANTFGEESETLKAFYKAAAKMAPGATTLREDMAGCLDIERTRYTWTMPDGFEVVTRVMVPKDMKVELQELKTEGGNSATFTHRVFREGQSKSYVAVVANATHSVDSLLVREIKRRARYDRTWMKTVHKAMQEHGVKADLYASEKFVSIRNMKNWQEQPKAIQSKLMAIMEQVMDYVAYDIVTVHDEFRCSPVHMNMTRFLYTELLAEIAESDLCQDLLRQLYRDDTIVYEKEGDGKELARVIREQSNYALS